MLYTNISFDDTDLTFRIKQNFNKNGLLSVYLSREFFSKTVISIETDFDGHTETQSPGMQ